MDARKIGNSGVLRLGENPYGPPVKLHLKALPAKKIMRLHSNENLLGASPRGVEMVSKMSSSINFYPEGSNLELCKRLASNFGLKPENVIVGNGGDEVIYYTAMSLINDEDEVILPEITFPVYKVAYTMMRARIIQSAMKGLAIDLEDILSKISKRTKIVVVCNPNNPTGYALGTREIEKFLDRIPSSIMVIIDEAYREFVEIPDYPDTVSLFTHRFPNIFILRSLSKAYGIAGLRVGYGIAHESIIGLINRIKLPFNITIISQHAAVSALEDEVFVKRTVELIKKEKNWLYRRLMELGLKYEKSHTNFIIIQTGNATERVTSGLQEKGIRVMNTKPYGLSGFIRVTVGTHAQNKRFITALADIISGEV